MHWWHVVRLDQTEQGIEKHFKRFVRDNKLLTQWWNGVVPRVGVLVDGLINGANVHRETAQENAQQCQKTHQILDEFLLQKQKRKKPIEMF